ncbi:MAG TPA: hypothetical protein VNE58_00450 [Casimicrobiaceae bacterium]|nr:hypothetical protein [Casimicrobiaceae bacterium]
MRADDLAPGRDSERDDDLRALRLSPPSTPRRLRLSERPLLRLLLPVSFWPDSFDCAPRADAPPRSADLRLRLRASALFARASLPRLAERRESDLPPRAFVSEVLLDVLRLEDLRLSLLVAMRCLD